MKTKMVIGFTLILTLTLLAIGPAFSASIFSVVGTVRNVDGTLAASGLAVIVSNETRTFISSDTLGSQEAGKYGVVFVDTGNKTVAVEGDVLEITVKDVEQTLANVTYQLTADDIAKGRAVVDVKIGAVIPANQPPVASFSFSPEAPSVNMEIRFDASPSHDADGQIISYEWNFGDGSAASGQVTRYSYISEGQYAVVLKVTDDDRESDTASFYVTVASIPTPPSLPELIQQQHKVSVLVTVDSEQYSIVTLDKYIHPETLELSPTSNETKVYTDRNWSPVSDLETVRRISVIDSALRESENLDLRRKIDELNTLQSEYKNFSSVDMGIAASNLLIAGGTDLAKIVSEIEVIRRSTEALTTLQKVKDLARTQPTGLGVKLIIKIMKEVIWDPSEHLQTELQSKIALASERYEDAQKILDESNITNYEDANTFLSSYQYAKVYEEEFRFLFDKVFRNWARVLMKLEPISALASISGTVPLGLTGFPKLIWEAKSVVSWEYAIDIEWIGRIGQEFYTRYYWFPSSEAAIYTLKLSRRSDSLSDFAEFQESYSEYLGFMDEVSKQQEDLMEYFNSPGKSFLNTLGNELSSWKNKLSSWTDTIKDTVSALSQRISNILGGLIRSPVDFRVYDSEGRVTGLVNGKIKEEIPDSTYYTEEKVVIILDATDTYRYELVGTDTGDYGLDVFLGRDEQIQTFVATDIPTTANALHQYTIDWDALSKGEEGVTVEIDENSDLEPERTITSDGELTQDEYLFVKSVTPNGKLPTTWADVKRTQLFQNYPNPFNPDTWIPYTLADRSQVTIMIYAATGQLVRTLNLGEKTAGAYITKGKAAHWDGYDDAGQPVASSVYFYTFQAGFFRATKKAMIIR